MDNKKLSIEDIKKLLADNGYCALLVSEDDYRQVIGDVCDGRSAEDKESVFQRLWPRATHNLCSDEFLWSKAKSSIRYDVEGAEEAMFYGDDGKAVG